MQKLLTGMHRQTCGGTKHVPSFCCAQKKDVWFMSVGKSEKLSWSNETSAFVYRMFPCIYVIYMIYRFCIPKTIFHSSGIWVFSTSSQWHPCSGLKFKPCSSTAGWYQWSACRHASRLCWDLFGRLEVPWRKRDFSWRVLMKKLEGGCLFWEVFLLFICF